MKATLAPTQYGAIPRTQTALFTLASCFLFFGLLWFEVINHLQLEWSQNPQYRYGWSAPFLALYLLWKRWLERPAPERTASPMWPGVVLVAGALLIFPVRFLAEANPDWRLLSWAFALIAVSMSLGFVFLVGGKSWLRHFAFPFLFVLVAVPWPMQIEQAVIQTLMRAVTSINVFLLSVAGIPALQHGNVIEVRSGLIGIEEACSGVRSLQATLMVSLFLGELYSFSIARRCILLLAGCLLAFFCNLVRTAILVWLGATHGASSIEAWHDPAGLTILLVCLFGLWGLSLLMQRSSPGIIAVQSTETRSPARIPTTLCLVLAVWLLLAEAGVQAWYHRHQSTLASSRWNARWPNSEQTYRGVVIPPETQGILRYDEGGGASWKGADAHPWMMYFFRWLPGHTAALFVKIHRPDVCLPASGMTLTRDDGIRLLAINGVNLPIRSYRFDDHGTPLHVFYCYWDARSSYESVAAATEEDWTARGRVRAALGGRREIGAQMLELVVWGYDDDAEANVALQRQLAQIIQSG